MLCGQEISSLALVTFVSACEIFTVKKKKPNLLNKFDKTIKSEINAAEKLRKKVGTVCFLFQNYNAKFYKINTGGLFCFLLVCF